MAAGTGTAAGTGVCICRKLGSFWNSVIFSAIGVGGGDGAYVRCATLVWERARVGGGVDTVGGLLRLRKRCLNDAVRFVGAGGSDGGSMGVGGNGPTGGGKGLINFAGGMGDAGMGVSVVGGTPPPLDDNAAMRLHWWRAMRGLIRPRREGT